MDTEVIAVLDGQWADPPIPDNPKVHLVYHSNSIGQRAATNEAARLSQAKYVMKCDAHCAFDKGFDRKLIAPYEQGELESNVTSVPRMYNLHGFDWECACGNRTYQGPKPIKCEKCKNENQSLFEMKVVWKPRMNRMSDFMRFDHELHFQYAGHFKSRPGAELDLAEQMTCVGACWMMTRSRYWEIEPCDELHGSWGQQGTEVACKSWLSGGRQVVNKRTWFSHMFRTQPGFGFPYPNPGIDKARKYSRQLWYGNKWDKQIYPLSWLIDKFKPVTGWHDPIGADILAKVNAAGVEYEARERGTSTLITPDPLPPIIVDSSIPADSIGSDSVPAPVPTQVGKAEGLTKGIVYYTDNRLDPAIMQTVITQLLRASNGIPITNVSLAPMIPFGNSIVLPFVRSYLTMFRQQLAGLKACKADIIFFCEHDILYHPSHFLFTPPSDSAYYYNENTYKVDSTSGQALFYYCKQVSGLCAYRKLLLEHYEKRVAIVEQSGYDRNMGFEPGCHRPPRGVDSYPAERWLATFPNVDIRHRNNLTPSRWSQDKFHNKNSCLGWTMSDQVPGWGVTKGRFNEFLASIPTLPLTLG